MPSDIHALILELSTANPLWGAPRVHGELQKLGNSVSQSTVAKYMRRHPRPPSQTWRTFLKNHASQIMAADLFVVPTITFRLLYVLVIVAHERRQIIHVAVTDDPTALWTAQQFRNAFPENDAPGYLLHDRDGAFAAVATTVAAMNIQAVRTAPRSPWQNAYVERVIGSIRRECLDHVIVANATGLHRILTEYVGYYMRARTHLALDKDAPMSRALLRITVLADTTCQRSQEQPTASTSIASTGRSAQASRWARAAESGDGVGQGLLWNQAVRPARM